MYARTTLNLAAATLLALFLASSARCQSLPVPKTNPFPVYMHYMPWFQTPTSQGGTGGSQWGWHWKMNTQNPNVVDASGKRQIASYYYPKIGPYDSSDPNVIEYHSLLMKYSGIDGVLIDWYGVQGYNGDVNSLLAASNAFVNKSNSYGLGFGVVLEDYFARNPTTNQPNLGYEQANMRYLRDNYFNRPNYIKYGAAQNPLMLVFGPQTFLSPADWEQILPETGTNPEFLTLPDKSSRVGANADGEYAWPHQDTNTSNHLSVLRSFYQSRVPQLKTAAGVAYPGFHDFYAPGGAGNTLFYIPENNGQTLASVLNLNKLFQPNLDMLQLATFNDYGEGTMFEPTVETGFNYLHQIQLYTGVSYGTDELELIYELYLARKKYAADAGRQSQLDQVVSYLAILQVDDARSLLSQVSPAGDFNADGSVTVADYNMWRAAFGKSTIIYGSGADGNFDGVIDARDYLVWRDAMAAAGNGALADAMAPEAGVGSLITVAVGAMSWFRARR